MEQEYHIRAKRPNKTLLGYWVKLYVPLPVAMKCDVQRVCREWEISQAEFGLRVMQFVFNHDWMLEGVRREQLAAAPERSTAAAGDSLTVVG